MLGIAGLLFQPRPIDRAGIKSRRGAGLEPGHWQVSAAQLLRQALRRTLPNPPADQPLVTPVKDSAQKCTGAQDHRGCFERRAVSQLDSTHPATKQAQRSRLSCYYRKIALQL